MRQLWAVTRVTLNSSFGISALRWRYLRRRERLWEPILIAWGIGTAVSFFGYGAYRLYLAMAAVGAVIGQPELPLGLAAVTSQILVLLMSFFMVVSSFYFSRDLPILVPLPLRPSAIVTAKFFTILVGEYVTISFIFWPAVLAYARFVEFGPGKALVTVLVFLMLPVLPLAVTALVSLTVMRSINRRHRDLLFYAASILFFGLVLVWQMQLGRLPQSGDLQTYLEGLITARLGLVRALTSRFPPAFWAAAAVHGGLAWEGLKGLLLTAATATAAVLVLRAAGERLFYRGLIGGEEVSRGRAGPAAARRRTRAGSRAASWAGSWAGSRAGSGVGGTAMEAGGVDAAAAAGTSAAAGALVGAGVLAVPRTPLRAMIAREWMLVLRTPVWVLNNLLPGAIVPLFMFVPLLGAGKLQADLARMLALPQGQTIAGLILAGILLFIGSLNGLAATAISREGPRLWISRVMPQSARMQAVAKLIMATTVAAASLIPSVVIFAALVRLPVLYVVLPAAAGLLGSLAANAVGLRVDLMRPMLRWKDPQEPAKRNLTALVPLGIALAFLALGWPLARMLLDADLGGPVVYLVFLLITGGLAMWTTGAVLGAAEELMSRLEV